MISMVGKAKTATKVIVVDRIACEGRGTCAELLPERIALDEWGYPFISSGPIGPDLLGEAQRAVKMCPLHALKLR